MIRNLSRRFARAETALVIFVLAVYWPVIAGGRTVWIWDATLNFFPNQFYFIERIRHGELPEWTHRVFGGFPFVADPVQGVFHPLKLFFLLPIERGLAVNLFVVLTYLVLGCGVVRLARKLGLSETAAAVAAIVFTGSGALASESNLNNFLLALVFVPWLWADVIDAAAGYRSRIPAALYGRVSILGAMTILAGEPLSYYVMFGMAALLLAVPPEAPAAGLKRVYLDRLKFLLVTGLFSGLIAAIQWMPTAALLPEVTRAEGRSIDVALHCSSYPGKFLETVLPLLFGKSGEPRTLWAQSLYCVKDTPAFYLSSYYLGAVPAAFFLAALFSLWRPEAPRPGTLSPETLRRTYLVWAAFLAACVILSLGRAGFLYPFLWEHFPLWNQFRIPERFIPWAMFPVALIAAFGVDRWWQDPDRRRRFAAGLIAAAGAVMVLTLAGGMTELGRIFSPSSPDAMHEVTADSFARFRLHALLSAGLLGISCVPKLKRWAPALLIAAVALPLLLNSRDVIMFQPGTDVVRSAPRGERAMQELFGDSGAPVRFLPLPVDLDAELPPGDPFSRRLTVFWNLLSYNVSQATPYESVRAFNSFVPNRYALLAGGMPDRMVARMFGVSAVTGPAAETAAYGSESRSVWGSIQVTKVADPVPRVVCPDSWQTVPLGDLRRRLADPGFDPRNQLLVESDPAIAGERSGPAAVCRLKSYRPEEVVAEIDQTDAAPVAVLINYMSGWSAEVNGAPAEIVPAWGLSQAVMVPAGRSVVTLRYRTPFLTEGMAVSAAALAIALWMLVRSDGIGIFRKRPPGA